MKSFSINKKFDEILRHEYIDLEKTLLKLELLKEYTKNECLGYELFRQALYANLTEEYEYAIEKAKEALKKAYTENNEYLIVKINVLLGFIYWNRKNYEACFDYYLTVLKYEKDARVLNNMGVIYHTFGDIDEAYKYYEMAKKEFNDPSNFRLKAIISTNLSECECEFGNFNKAEKLLEIALDINLQLGSKDGTAYIYNAFGLLEMKKQNYQRAIEYFQKGEDFYKNEKILIYYLDLLRNHAKALYEIKEYEETKLKINEIEKLRITYNFGCRNQNEVELLAKIYNIEGKYKEANTLYREYIEIVKRNKQKNNKIRVKNLRNKVELFEVKKKINTLEKISKTDALTGIKNRHSLKDYRKTVLSNEGIRLETAIVIIDVDYYKQYNDFYGHAKGDECLVKIVEKLSNKLNSCDSELFRYGGDEFLVIIPNTNKNNVLQLLESIRNDIEFMRIENVNSKVSDYVTCSFGVTTVKEINELNYEEIFALADKALYNAKAGGKNRISFI
ncbi:hypothetical protein SH2C18_38830 [Clostridium sediminicola]|uniref:tetratricopeptide repeat-containing diguanylate cyclase n=1 Tax=Clostridium sediminicola TaxID=3114879 RepID=UPI0031F1E35C